MKGKFFLILIVLAVLCTPTIAYSGKVEYPELFTYNDEMNANLETALNLISYSFNEKNVSITQELLAAMMTTLVKAVGNEQHKFLPSEEDWYYGMGTGGFSPSGCMKDEIEYYQGGVDYKGRGYIQLTLKDNYQKYCGQDCIGTSTPQLNVCGCKDQRQCTVTDETICPQIKALSPDRAARIFASYYIESPRGINLVSLSNKESYRDVGYAINPCETYAFEFETYAKKYLTLFRNNPDKTEKFLTWLNNGTSTPPMAVDVL